MRNRTTLPRDNVEEDEGELNSDEESESTSSEGVTSDGEVDSDEDDRSDRTRSPVEETPWERGFRLARERAKKVKLLRQNDVDLEEKKLKLTVVAPDPNEEDAPAAASELGRSNFADIFWLDYYKLAVVGCTQLTGKRSLPCDLSPPSQNAMSRWRRRLLDARTRSVDASSATSPASTNCRSRASSLSSLAGSILLAVPDLIIADDSDREQQRRRRRGGGRRGCSTSSNTSSSGESHRRRRSSSSRSGISSRSSTKDQKKKGRSASSASSVSSSSSSAPAYPRSREKIPGKESGSKRRVSPRRRGLGDADQRTSWRSRRPPQLAHSDQRQAPQTLPQISGYHHQQRGFTDRTRDDFGTNENGSVGPNRQGYADSNRWEDSTHRSPDRPPPMPSEKPIKRPWVADPSLKSKAPILQRSPSPSTRMVQPRTRSPSRASSPSAVDNVGQTNTTYITSWSQPRDRDASVSPPLPIHQQHRGSLRRQSSKSALPDVVPSQIASSPPSRKRPAPSRRKSRSPFANIDFGNPPAPMRPSLRDHRGPPPELSFEQTVPLLAGAVNPAAPSTTKALPSASSRPGVKLKIAPRVRAAPVLPGSALDKAHHASGGGGAGGGGGGGVRVGASPVSSATSSRGSSQSPSKQHPRRDNVSSMPSQFQSEPSAVKRMRQLGYTAVSPGGFESPPSPASRPYGRNRRPDLNEISKGRRSDQGRGDGYRNRTSGEFHEHVDRFPRSAYLHQPPDRYRERRQHVDNFDRHRQSFDRSRSGRFGRDYNAEPHYGRSRGEERISGRSYGGRHGNRRQGNPARSRSPFEGRGGGSGDVHLDMATEQRLNELRQRLTMVDDKIAELGGASAVGHR